MAENSPIDPRAPLPIRIAERIKEQLTAAWPTLYTQRRRMVYIAVSAIADPEHPLHDDVVAIFGDPGKTQEEKKRKVEELIEPILRPH